MDKKKFDHIIEKIRAVLNDEIGFYPAAVSGFGDERDYKERTEFMNGHNDAMGRVSSALWDVIYEETGECHDNYKCHECDGKGYYTQAEYDDKYGER